MTRCERTLVLSLAVVLALLTTEAEPIPEDVPRAVVHRTAGEIVVDGRLEETSWGAAQRPSTSRIFHRTRSWTTSVNNPTSPSSLRSGWHLD